MIVELVADNKALLVDSSARLVVEVPATSENNENQDWEEFESTLVRDIKWRIVEGKIGRLQYWVSCEKSKGW